MGAAFLLYPGIARNGCKYSQTRESSDQMADNPFVHDMSPQDFFDAFNKFIISPDTKVFDKLVSKHLFLNMTKGLPGDIVELGVFKGSGVFVWLKMLKHLSIQKQVYGFDLFNSETLIEGISTQDKDLMADLFDKRRFNPLGYGEYLERVLNESGFSNNQILAGDVFQTIPSFLEENPGFRAAVINFDLDTFEPTYFALNQLWERVVPGGVLVFDEYGVNEWTESIAVDRFVSEKNLKLISTNLSAPSAYLIKP